MTRALADFVNRQRLAHNPAQLARVAGLVERAPSHAIEQTGGSRHNPAQLARVTRKRGQGQRSRALGALAL